MKILILFAIFSIILFQKCFARDMDMSLVEEIDERKTICDALDQDDTDLKLKNVEDPINYEDILRLTMWNLKFNLKSGYKQLKVTNGKWRRPIVNKIFEIFQKACPDDYVPHQFTYVIREMGMIYYNSLKQDSESPPDRWNNTMKVLTDCRTKIEPLNVDGHGLLIDMINFEGESVPLLPPEELADSIPAVDLIIDNMWWIFSLSYGICYSPAGFRSSWAPRYKRIFYEDFIIPIINRWGHIGPEANFGVVFGNFDLSNILTNIRLCVTAAYTTLGIADRQLVRPLTLDHPNEKTGGVFSKKK